MCSLKQHRHMVSVVTGLFSVAFFPPHVYQQTQTSNIILAMSETNSYLLDLIFRGIYVYEGIFPPQHINDSGPFYYAKYFCSKYN